MQLTITFFAGILLLSTTLLGAGCNLSNIFNQATQPVVSSTNLKMSETEYYNKVIQLLNNMSDETGRIQDSYLRFSNAGSVDQRTNSVYAVPTTFYDMAKKDIVDTKPEMENGDAQATIEEKFTPYLIAYKTMLDANNALAEYYERGRYQDDEEAKKDELGKNLLDSLNQVKTLQNELLEMIEQYQDKIDLGIDENTTDPFEIVTLAQDSITDDVEKLYEDYQIWINAYDADPNTADVTNMQSSFEALNTDYEKFTTKAETGKIKDISFVGSNFDTYMKKVDEFSVKFENIIRDGKNKQIEDVITLDNETVELYNEVIDAHNSLVSSVQSQAKLAQ